MDVPTKPRTDLSALDTEQGAAATVNMQSRGMHQSRGERRSMCNAWNKMLLLPMQHRGMHQQAYNGGVFIKHGAKRHKICRSEGCTNQVYNEGVCFRHGKRCSYDGCTNGAIKAKESVSNMEQILLMGAVTRDAPTELEREVSALDMMKKTPSLHMQQRSSNSVHADTKDVPILL